MDRVHLSALTRQRRCGDPGSETEVGLVLSHRTNRVPTAPADRRRPSQGGVIPARSFSHLGAAAGGIELRPPPCPVQHPNPPAQLALVGSANTGKGGPVADGQCPSPMPLELLLAGRSLRGYCEVVTWYPTFLCHSREVWHRSFGPLRDQRGGPFFERCFEAGTLRPSAGLSSRFVKHFMTAQPHI